MQNKILVSFLGLFLVGATALPALSLAQTTEATSVNTENNAELQAQIQSLLGQISSLQAQLEALQRTPVEIQPAQRLPLIENIVPLARDLVIGSRGEDVRGLQNFLRKEGHFTYPEDTGFFGPITEVAVRDFQGKNNLPQVGRVGPQTRSKIATILASYPGSGVTTSTANTSLIRNYSFTPVPESNKALIEWNLTERARATVYATCSEETHLLITGTGDEVVCPQKGDLILAQQTGSSGQVVFTPLDDSAKVHVVTTLIATNENGNDKAGWGVSFPIKSEDLFTVLSPGGGEIWESHSQHTISWSGIDPDSDNVDAYVEVFKDGVFSTVGQVVPVGKGSIIWTGEINQAGNYLEPGNYYIRLVDRVTGKSARSSGTFKFVEHNNFVQADVKVKNNQGVYSDGPVTVDSREIEVFWQATNADSCWMLGYSSDTQYSTEVINFPKGVTAGDTVVLLPGDASTYYLKLNCTSSLYGGNTSEDNVQINLTNL